jgi:hypothetical protein
MNQEGSRHKAYSWLIGSTPVGDLQSVASFDIWASCQNEINPDRLSLLSRVRCLCIVAAVWSTVTQTLDLLACSLMKPIGILGCEDELRLCS